MPFVITVFLEEDASPCIVRGIMLCSCWEIGIEDAEDGGCDECLFEGFKSNLSCWSPLPWLIFFGEVGEGVCNVGEFEHESPIVVGQS